MLKNALVKVSTLTGTKDNKTYSVLASNVEALIVPASTEILTLYPDLPIGSSYAIQMRELSGVPAEAEIEVTDAMSGEYTVGDIFKVVGISRRTKILGQVVIEAVTVKL